jgi:hypothetical protein
MNVTVLLLFVFLFCFSLWDIRCLLCAVVGYHQDTEGCGELSIICFLNLPAREGDNTFHSEVLPSRIYIPILSDIFPKIFQE